MASEYEKDGKRVIQPKISQWKLTERERALFQSADRIPNWKLADKSRRLAADMCNHLSTEIPSQIGLTVKGFNREAARQFAVVAVAGITTRSIGGAMAMISCGHIPEAAGPTRRAVEAKLHGRAVVDDDSGDYAIRYLQGRGRSLAKLAQKYRNTEDVNILSKLAHADVFGLSIVTDEVQGEGEVTESVFSVLPHRDDAQAGLFLYMLAYEAGSVCALLAEAFDVGFEIPPWVSNELLRNRDALKKGD